MLRRLPAIVLVPLLATATACGGSAKKVDPAADLALAKRSTLTAADMPGYESAPHTKDEDIPAALKKQFADCLKVPSTVFDDTPGAQKADSPDFSKGDTTVSNSIEIDPKKSDIDTGWNQLSRKGIEPCLKDLFEAGVKQGAPSANVTFHDTTVDRFEPKVGSRSVGYLVKIDAEAGGQRLKFYVDLLFVARDRAGIDLEFDNPGQPFDRALEITLAQKVYDRIGKDAR